MKTTDKTSTPPASQHDVLPAIETTALDQVTGGCACGQDCAAGALGGEQSRLPNELGR